ATICCRSCAAGPSADSVITAWVSATTVGEVASSSITPLTLSVWSGAYRPVISPPNEWPTSTTGLSAATWSMTPVTTLSTAAKSCGPFGLSLAPWPSRSNGHTLRSSLSVFWMSANLVRSSPNPASRRTTGSPAYDVPAHETFTDCPSTVIFSAPAGLAADLAGVPASAPSASDGLQPDSATAVATQPSAAMPAALAIRNVFNLSGVEVPLHAVACH